MLANNREAQFLASQKARLSKIQEAHEVNDSDANAQSRRKEFWQTFKLECSSTHQRLSDLIDEAPTEETKEGGDSNSDSIGNSDRNGDKSLLFVTAQQRNEALEKLQQIQLSVQAIHHYTLRSTKFSKDSAQFLPEFFAQNEMPELPTADLRLLNTELQSLKKKTQEVHQIIIPKEKFRFKRYHALMLERKQLKGPIFEEDEDEKMDQSEEKDEVESDNSNANATFDFDGLALTNQKNSVIVVENDGTIDIKANDTQGGMTERLAPSTTSSQAFLIRNIDGCKVQVHGLYNSVHIINSNNSTIQIASPIHGPVHVTNCKDTVLQIPFSRQLRIHDCTNVTFIIHVASGPIIEGCKDMKFYQKDLCSTRTTAGGGGENFDPGTNLYWDVKDFNWLKNNVKSPNMDVYSEAELEKDADASALVASFLRAVSVQDQDGSGQAEGGSVVNKAITEHMDEDGSDADSSDDEL